MKWFKIEAKIGLNLDSSEDVIYINPDLLGDTVYKAYSRYYKEHTYKVDYSNTFLFLKEETFNSLLNYFKSLEREEKINSIIE